MNDDQLTDLKQFITATVSQSEQRLEQRLTGRIDSLEKKLDEGFAVIGDIMSSNNDQLQDHETRITKLETSKA